MHHRAASQTQSESAIPKRKPASQPAKTIRLYPYSPLCQKIPQTKQTNRNFLQYPFIIWIHPLSTQAHTRITNVCIYTYVFTCPGRCRWSRCHCAKVYLMQSVLIWPMAHCQKAENSHLRTVSFFVFFFFSIFFFLYFWFKRMAKSLFPQKIRIT